MPSLPTYLHKETDGADTRAYKSVGGVIHVSSLWDYNAVLGRVITSSNQFLEVDAVLSIGQRRELSTERIKHDVAARLEPAFQPENINKLHLVYFSPET